MAAKSERLLRHLLQLLVAGVGISIARPDWQSQKTLRDVVKFLPKRLDEVELTHPPELHLTGEIPVDSVVREGSNAELSCEASGIPPPLIRWTFNGKPVDLGRYDNTDNTAEKLLNYGRRTIQHGITKSKLKLDCVTSQAAGVYGCVADNGYERIETEARLTVKEGNSFSACQYKRKSKKGKAPHIYLWSTGRFEDEGNAVQLYCRAQGNPEPQIKWMILDENEQEMEIDQNFKRLPSGDLVIERNALKNFFNTLKCVARNKYGEDEQMGDLYYTEPEPLGDGSEDYNGEGMSDTHQEENDETEQSTEKSAS